MNPQAQFRQAVRALPRGVRAPLWRAWRTYPAHRDVIARHTVALARRATAPLVRRTRSLEPRNAPLVATPDVIRTEIEATQTVIASLGRDVFDLFCAPFAANVTEALRIAETKTGRTAPAKGDEQDPTWREVYRLLQLGPEAPEWAQRCYQPRFVSAYRLFQDEWSRWYYAHQGWVDRFWGGIWEQAIDFRKRALAWRERLTELELPPRLTDAGELVLTHETARPSMPAPLIPDTSLPWNKILALAGLGAAALIVPAAIRAFAQRN